MKKAKRVNTMKAKREPVTATQVAPAEAQGLIKVADKLVITESILVGIRDRVGLIHQLLDGSGMVVKAEADSQPVGSSFLERTKDSFDEIDATFDEINQCLNSIEQICGK